MDGVGVQTVEAEPGGAGLPDQTGLDRHGIVVRFGARVNLSRGNPVCVMDMQAGCQVLAQGHGRFEFHLVALLFPLAFHRVGCRVQEAFIVRIVEQGIEGGLFLVYIVVAEVAPEADGANLPGALGIELHVGRMLSALQGAPGTVFPVISGLNQIERLRSLDGQAGGIAGSHPKGTGLVQVQPGAVVFPLGRHQDRQRQEEKG